MEPVSVTLNLGRCSFTAALQGEYIVLRATDFVAAGGGGGGSLLSDLPQRSRRHPHNSVSRCHPHQLEGGSPQTTAAALTAEEAQRRPRARLRSPPTAASTVEGAKSGTALPRSVPPPDFPPKQASPEAVCAWLGAWPLSLWRLAARCRVFIAEAPACTGFLHTFTCVPSFAAQLFAARAQA